MKVAALFPVGQTSGGCINSIREILRGVDGLDVYILHGVLAPGQEGVDPKACAREIASTDYGGRVHFRHSAPIDTFNLNAVYATAREMVRLIDKEGYARVYVGMTGGTNPLLVSVFQTAMTYLSAEVLPVYAQGKDGQTLSVTIAPEIRTAYLAEEAIRAGRSGQLRLAAALAARLPAADPWQFVSACLAALAAWDDFDYQAARATLRQQARKCADYQQDPLLASLSATVARLAAVADRMVKLTGIYRNPDPRDVWRESAKASWPQRIRSDGTLLVADALENSRRRILEGRFTDSVLRSYRAAECATQNRLFALGIHPQFPPGETVNEGRPGPLGFAAGLSLLASREELDFERIQRLARELGPIRNQTYLEHGYVRIESHVAERCLSQAEEICSRLLGPCVADAGRHFVLTL